MKRKFVTEYALSFMNSNVILMTSEQLMSGDVMTEDQKREIDKCHIYMIATRPQAYFKENEFTYENNVLSGSLFYKIEGNEHEIKFDGYKWLREREVVKTTCPYPHREICNYDENGNITTYVPASYLSMNINSDIKELACYDVLYVGQALGAQGNKSAFQRLQSHSTLQKILAKIHYNSPDKEIMILMYQFDHENMFTSMDGRAKDVDQSDKNEHRLFNAVDNPPNKKQKIGLIEAGLIRYFQPEYNEMFKIKFPSVKHKTLQSCYKLDISGLIIEINTEHEHLNYLLYSKKQNKRYHHIAQIDLVAQKNRMSFFQSTDFVMSPDIIK